MVTWNNQIVFDLDNKITSRPRQRFLSLFFSLALIFPPLFVSASDKLPNEVGWVEYFSGPSTNYVVHRDGKPFKIALLFPVRSGDLIDINSDDGEVRLRMADESIRSLTKESMPYTVDLQVKAPTVISNLMQWVGGWLTDQHDTRQKKIASLVIRGEKPRPRFVFGLADHEDDAAALLAHERPLFFSIKGGEPPFRLKIFSSDGQMPIIDLPELSAREIHTPSIKLAPGDYRVEIDDLNKQRGKGYFKTLPGQKLPEFPDIQADGSELDQLLTLTWLAAYGDGEWLYESYQRAAQLAQHSYPARLVRDALARGYIPESPGE